MAAARMCGRVTESAVETLYQRPNEIVILSEAKDPMLAGAISGYEGSSLLWHQSQPHLQDSGRNSLKGRCWRRQAWGPSTSQSDSRSESLRCAQDDRGLAQG